MEVIKSIRGPRLHSQRARYEQHYLYKKTVFRARAREGYTLCVYEWSRQRADKMRCYRRNH